MLFRSPPAGDVQDPKGERTWRFGPSITATTGNVDCLYPDGPVSLAGSGGYDGDARGCARFIEDRRGFVEAMVPVNAGCLCRIQAV